MGSKTRHLLPTVLVILAANLAAWTWAAFGLGTASEAMAAALLDQMGLEGCIWSAIGVLNDRFGSLGLGVIALFLRMPNRA